VTADFGRDGKRTDRWNYYLNKVITFTTEDETAQVEEYYKYSFVTWRSEHTPDGLHFYDFGRGSSPTMYIIDVYTKRITQGSSTEVRIEAMHFPGY
jgi:hypothetical protein